jgi:hypothetical protein
MPVDFTGTWKNQNGSLLELAVLATVVTGRFESGVGDNGEKLWVQVSGRVLDDVITFNVVYERFATVVAWVGQHTVEGGVGKIKSLWLHASNVPNDQEEAWMWFSNRVGADVFTRA